jgi:hypothetical protein
MFQLPDLLGIASAGAVAGFAKTMVRRDGVRVVDIRLTIASYRRGSTWSGMDAGVGCRTTRVGCRHAL